MTLFLQKVVVLICLFKIFEQFKLDLIVVMVHGKESVANSNYSTSLMEIIK